jgi:hypothetical protein
LLNGKAERVDVGELIYYEGTEEDITVVKKSKILDMQGIGPGVNKVQE